MAARLSDDLVARLVLTFGPDRVEAAPIGWTRISSSHDGATLFVTLDLKLDEIERELFHTVDLPERDHVRNTCSLHAPAWARIERLKKTFPEAFRAWIYSLLVWDTYSAGLSRGNWLSWLESEGHRLPQLLGVPNVQERIKDIREKGSAKIRQDLADVLAGRSDGRPRGKPWDNRVLYHEVKDLVPALHGLAEKLNRSQNKADVFRQLKAQAPAVVAYFEKLGLRKQWCSTARVSNRRRQLSGYSMACDVIARRRYLASSTVEKLVGPIHKRRAGP